MATTGDNPNPVWFHMYGKPIAIPFDFVSPVVAARRFLHQQGGGRFNSRRHRIQCKLRLTFIAWLGRLALEW